MTKGTLFIYLGSNKERSISVREELLFATLDDHMTSFNVARPKQFLTVSTNTPAFHPINNLDARI
jgi:hypothetical protein